MGGSIANLNQGLKALNLNFSSEQIGQIERYLNLLIKWNRTFNLTAIKEPEAMVTHHVLDSLAILPLLVGQRFLDVGTGAGLPGMMLAIACPTCHFVLLDSNSKKISFIKQAVHQLGVQNVEVVHSRIEDFEPLILFDEVISRAFTNLADFVRLCLRLLTSGGMLLAMKGPKVFEEIKECQYDVRIEKIDVPFLEEARYGVLVKPDDFT